MSDEGRRRLREAERGRLGATIGILFFAAAMLWRALAGGGQAWIIPFALGLALAILGGVRLVHRRQLAGMGPGQRWVGSVYVDVPAWRDLARLADAAPRSGFLTALLLSQDLAPGKLVVEADGLAWQPSRLSRWSGAQGWRLARGELAGVETGPVPGVARIGGGMALLVWLADGEALAMRATAPKGLVPALEELGLVETGGPTSSAGTSDQRRGAETAQGVGDTEEGFAVAEPNTSPDTGSPPAPHEGGEDAMSAADVPPGFALAFTLAPPEVYVPLDPATQLEGHELRAAATRLVDERAALDQLVAARRSQWIDHVVTFWEDAREKQALDAWTMVYEVDDLPVKAFVLAFGAEREHPENVDAEIRSLEAALAASREGDVGERHVSVVQLPTGPAVRARGLAETDPGKRRSVVIDVVEYWVPVAGHPEGLLLTFTTSVLVVADILAEIADDIAQSLRFVRADDRPSSRAEPELG